jgi:4-amino-4-deoxy-L-arabinose transferase-like glycosyltransferase
VPAERRNHDARAWVVLALIALAALVLRVYRLPELPGPIYSDEAYNGVDALAVLAGWHPIFFPANNGREPLHIYLQAISVGLLGPTDFALRIVNGLVGTATVVVVALLGRSLLGWRTGLLAAAFLAISYWHITLSRLSFRVIELPLWTAIATLLAVWALKRRGWHSWLCAGAAGVALGASLYTYTSSRIFPFAFVLVLLALGVGGGQRTWAHWRSIVRTLAIAAAVSIVVAAPLMLYFVRHPEEALRRADQVVLGGPDDPRVSREHMRPRTLPENLGVTIGAFGFVGDSNVRENLPGRPIFDFVTLAALAGGCATVVGAWRRSVLLGCLGWIAVMLVPAAISAEAPHFLRMAGVIPPTFVLAGIGAERLAALRSPTVRWGPVVVAGLLAWGTVDTVHAYFVDYAAAPDRPIQFDAHVHLAVDRARELAAEGIPTWVYSPMQHPLFSYQLRPEQRPHAFFQELPRAVEAARQVPGALAMEWFGHGVIGVNEIGLLSVRPDPPQRAWPLAAGTLSFRGAQIVGARPDPDDPSLADVEAWLYLRAEEPLGRRYDVSLVARDGAGTVLAVGRDPWAPALWPSTLWHPGEAYAFRTDLRLPLALVSDGVPIDLAVELSEVPRQAKGPAVLETVLLGPTVLPRPIG